VSELPEFITIKGKQVAIRGVVQRSLLDRSTLLPVNVAAVPALPAGVAPAPVPVVATDSAKTALTVAEVAENQGGKVVIRGLRRKVVATDKLTDKDRDYRDAALLLCYTLDAARGKSGLSVRRCCQALAERILSGDVLPELAAAEQATYLKPRQDGQTASSLASRLSKLYSAFLQGIRSGDPAAFLTPGKREKIGFNPVWVESLLKFYCDPHRPSTKQAWKAQVAFLTEQGVDAPSYDTAVKILASLPVTVKNRKRATGSEWDALLPYTGRDVSMFHSNDFWVCDGHTFKAKVLHPVNGQPFQPELTVVLDWVSRKIVGWSVGLSESMIAVSEAFRHAQMTTRARPLIYYTDNGGGQTNKVFDHPIHGTLSKQGIAHHTGIPGNPQGRGVIERLWQTTAIPLAQTYASCTWRGADKNTVRKTLQRMNKKDENKWGAPTWKQFIDDVAEMVRRYNFEHHHSALGMVPEQAYQDRIDPGSIVFGPSDQEIDELWMPEVSRKPLRGVIKLFGNAYFNANLVHLLRQGEKVHVRYDMHDARKVKVYRTDGSFICEAGWKAHVREAFPVSQMEQQREKREQRMVKRGEAIIAEAQSERQPIFDALPVIEQETLEFATLIPMPVRDDEVELSHQEVCEAMFRDAQQRQAAAETEEEADDSVGFAALLAGFDQWNEEEDDDEGGVPVKRAGAA
jgi:putative transposase